MTTPLPIAIATYFTATNRHDREALLAGFADDAVVTDEGKMRRGAAEIRRWREETDDAFQYTIAVLDTERRGDDDYVVTARLEGNFPGNVVDLRLHFTMRGDRIAALAIAP